MFMIAFCNTHLLCYLKPSSVFWTFDVRLEKKYDLACGYGKTLHNTDAVKS